MHALELRIPPPIVLLITGLLMWLLSWAFPSFAFAMPMRLVLAGVLAFLGLAIGILGAIAFRRAATTVNPMKPQTASSLVTSGVYRLTRNPMYLGLLIVLLGWTAFLANALSLLPIVIFILYISRFQIQPEERALESLFGAEFTTYKTRVRRWI
jgi:protein-S-isoprenylcysteine O-methyltransferase Ste14